MRYFSPSAWIKTDSLHFKHVKAVKLLSVRRFLKRAAMIRKVSQSLWRSVNFPSLPSTHTLNHKQQCDANALHLFYFHKMI